MKTVNTGAPNPRANAPAGARFHRRPGSMSRGRASMKSHSKPGAGEESPTGFRSRGPSAERAARRVKRKSSLSGLTVSEKIMERSSLANLDSFIHRNRKRRTMLTRYAEILRKNIMEAIRDARQSNR